MFLIRQQSLRITLSSRGQTFSSRCSSRRPCDRVSSIIILSDSTTLADVGSFVTFLGNISISSHTIWLKLDVLVVRTFKNEVKLSSLYLHFFAGVRGKYIWSKFATKQLILMAVRQGKKGAICHGCYLYFDEVIIRNICMNYI